MAFTAFTGPRNTTTVYNSSNVIEQQKLLDIFLKAIKAKDELVINQNFDQMIQSSKQNSIYLKDYLIPYLEGLTDSQLSLDTKFKIVQVIRKMSLELLTDVNIKIDFNSFEEWFKFKETELKTESCLYFECIMLQEILSTAKDNPLDLRGCWERIIVKAKNIYFTKNAIQADLIKELTHKYLYRRHFKHSQQSIYVEDLEKTRAEIEGVKQKLQRFNNNSSANKNQDSYRFFPFHAELSAQLEYHQTRESELLKNLKTFSSSSLPISCSPPEHFSISTNSMHEALNNLSQEKQDYSQSKKRKREGVTEEHKNSKKIKLTETETATNPESLAVYYLNKAKKFQDGGMCVIDSELMTCPDLLKKAIQTNPKLAEAYYVLNRVITIQPVFLLSGQKMTKQELLLKVIELDPLFAKAYLHLGHTLLFEFQSEITLNDGTKMNRQTLFLKAMDLDPSLSAEACLSLAVTLFPQRKASLNDPHKMTQQEVEKKQLLLKTIHLNPSLIDAYYYLSKILSPNEKISLLDGREMTQQELYKEAIRFNPKSGYAYLYLAKTLSSEKVDISAETAMDKKELLLKAIEFETSFKNSFESKWALEDAAEVYIELGDILSPTETITLPNKKIMTQQQLYLQANHIHPMHARAMFKLGTTLDSKEEITLLNKTKINRQQLFSNAVQIDKSLFTNVEYYSKHLVAKNAKVIPTIKHKPSLEAIKNNPNSAQAYFDLSMLIQQYPITLLDGTSMNQEQLLLKTIDLQPLHALAYMHLATIFYGKPLSTSITLLNKETMTIDQLYLKAAQLDPSQEAFAYYNIGISLPVEGSIQIGAKRWAQAELFNRASQLNPSLTSHIHSYYTSITFSPNNQ